MSRLSALIPLAAVSALAMGVAAPVAAQSSDDQFATFAPTGEPIDHRIDYAIWDEAMSNLVISMGPSLRQTAGSAEPGLGSRRIYGHTSRYRLEGTRIMFSFLDAEVISSFGEYRRDLVGQYRGRRHQVGTTYFVAGTPARWLAVFRRSRPGAHQQSQQQPFPHNDSSLANQVCDWKWLSV